MVNSVNIFGLLISVAILGYGISGLMAGRISGSSIWNNYGKKDVWGPMHLLFRFCGSLSVL